MGQSMRRGYRTVGRPAGEEIAAIVVGLFLPDSQGIETFDTLLRERPDVPINVEEVPSRAGRPCPEGNDSRSTQKKDN